MAPSKSGKGRDESLEPEYEQPAPESESTQEPADPTDLANIRIAPQTEAPTKRGLVSVQVHKPKKSDFIRVRDGNDNVVEAHIVEYALDDKNRDTYLVTNHGTAFIADRHLVPVRLFVAINRRGTEFLWPAKLPREGSIRGQSWSRSALELAEKAKKHWLQVVSNMDNGAYEAEFAKGKLSDPEWSDRTLQDLIKLGFQDLVINTEEHPVVRGLQGEE